MLSNVFGTNSVASKIYLIPAVGIICFLGFLAAVIFNGNDSVSRLESLETKFYPILAKAEKRLVLLNEVSEGFVTAAITGESDAIVKAEEVYNKLVKLNQSLISLDLDNESVHRQRNEDLKTYFSLAKRISNALLGNSDGDVSLTVQDRKDMSGLLSGLESHYAQFRDDANASLTAVIDGAKQSSELVIKLGIIIGLVSIALSIVTSIPVQRKVTSSLKQVTDSLSGFASGNGDLTVRLPVEGIKEIAELSTAFNSFISKLHQTFRRVIELSNQLSSHAFNVSSAAEETSVISGIQSQNAKSAQSNVNSLFEEINLISDNSQKAEDYSITSHKSAENGKQMFSNTVDSIKHLRDSAKGAVSDMEELLANVSHVTNVLDVIQNITSQTNLLALNAAIEAARAGEKGRGFAVVADEVRVLATKTQESATDIQTTFEKLQQGTRLVSDALNGSQEKAEASFSEIGKAHESLEKVATDIDGIKSVSGDIAKATQNQVKMTQVFASTIEEMITSSVENENASNELATVSSKLAELASELTKITNEFNV